MRELGGCVWNIWSVSHQPGQATRCLCRFVYLVIEAAQAAQASDRIILYSERFLEKALRDWEILLSQDFFGGGENDA
jgi:hypothetical protein